MSAPKSMILCAVAVSGLLLVLFTPCPAQESHPVDSEANSRFADTQSKEAERSELSPNVLQIARIIGVESDIEKLSFLAAVKEVDAAAGLSLEELSLRQQIADALLAASLNIDSVVAEIDYEREQTVELRSLWRYQRDRGTRSTNLAVLAAGTGLGIASGILKSSGRSGAGGGVGVAAGGLSTLFLLRSFRQAHSGRRPSWVLPNMLAAFLGQPEQHTPYPDDIWAYLNSVPSGAVCSRRDQMLAGWLAAGRIGPSDSPQWKRRTALLTSTNAADKDLKIEVLNERAAMLADVSDQISSMKHDLADLLRELRPK